jgi:hypothetical protein
MMQFIKKQAMALKAAVVAPSLNNPYTWGAGVLALAVLGWVFF